MVEGLAPGDWVRNPLAPEWGLGQVQSVIGDRVTANFENAGKRLINAAVVSLTRVESPAPRSEILVRLIARLLAAAPAETEIQTRPRPLTG